MKRTWLYMLAFLLLGLMVSTAGAETPSGEADSSSSDGSYEVADEQGEDDYEEYLSEDEDDLLEELEDEASTDTDEPVLVDVKKPVSDQATDPASGDVSESETDEALFNSGGSAYGSKSDLSSSPRNWTVHLSFGAYSLDYMDDEFGGSGSNPAESIFGNKNRFMFQLGAERLLWQEFGTIGLEAATGFWQTYGKGVYSTSGEESPDSTVFNMIPLKLSAVYRFSATWDKWNVPLIPFVKLGMDYYIWWILGPGGGTSTYEDEEGNRSKGYGGTFGFHISYGLQLCLDFMDKKLANEFDQDAGVNNTHLYFEGTFAKVNDFWAGSSFDLSAHHFMGGLLLEF